MVQSKITVYFHRVHSDRPGSENKEMASKIPWIVQDWVGDLQVKVDNCWFEYGGSHKFQFTGDERVISGLCARIESVRASGWPVEVVCSQRRSQ